MSPPPSFETSCGPDNISLQLLSFNNGCSSYSNNTFLLCLECFQRKSVKRCFKDFTQCKALDNYLEFLRTTTTTLFYLHSEMYCTTFMTQGQDKDKTRCLLGPCTTRVHQLES